MKEDATSPRQIELRRLLEAGDDARRALGRLDHDRHRLQQELAGIEATVSSLQESLSLAARLQVQEDYLASQLQRLDEEIAAEPARASGKAPGGVERRAAPRPAPIPMPILEPVEIGGTAQSRSASLLDRARRALHAATLREPARR